MPDQMSVQPDPGQAVSAQECDVLVVGGGPGGSTMAALLAEQGRDVVVIEKDRHPRFHIGESLLPANLPLFERLGIADEVRQIGVYKPGAEFVSDFYDKANIFLFETAPFLAAPNSYQVRRAELDQLLFETCRRRGARTFENTRVVDIGFPPPNRPTERPIVTALDAAGRSVLWRPRFVVDASGRDTLIANRLGLKVANKRNNTAAIFGHFHDVVRREGTAEGVITIHLVEGGWFWMIPLPDRIMSVGMVGGPSLFKNRKQSIDELFWSVVQSSPSVSARMRNARPAGPLTTTGNYSYRARVTGGEHFLMIGDAFAFIDPIFSSGVMLAMSTAELGAKAIDLLFRDETRGRAALRTVDRRIRQATTELSWLIYRINDPLMRFMLLHPTNRFQMRNGLLALLAGHFFEARVSPVPMMVFKLIHRVLSLMSRLGLDPAPLRAAAAEPRNLKTSGAQAVGQD